MIETATVRFLRRRQVAEYAPAEAEVTLVLGHGEITPEMVEEYLDRARLAVNQTLMRATEADPKPEPKVKLRPKLKSEPEKLPEPAPQPEKLPEPAPQPEKLPEPAPQPEKLPEPAPQPEPTAHRVPANYDELQKFVYELAKKLGPDGGARLRELRASYGVPTLQALPQDKWADFLARGAALVEG